MTDSKQISAWRGAFGDAYVERNVASDERVRNSARAFDQILGHLGNAMPKTVLEVGANVGANLAALKALHDVTLHAVEPNAKARAKLIESGIVGPGNVHDATATSLPFADASIDLVFTCGVLIHIPDDQLADAYHEMHRVASRYLLAIEYFSPTPVRVPYRGETDLLFKRDFGEFWLELYPFLEVVADGFFWKRTTGLDNLNWWLFRK